MISKVPVESDPPSNMDTATHTKALPKFPHKFPKTPTPESLKADTRNLVEVLRTIRRCSDISIDHLEALGLHVIQDAMPEQIIPCHSYLPRKEWLTLSASELDGADKATKLPMSNYELSPGAGTYVDRIASLRISNEDAYRTVRREPVQGLPSPALGHAHQFFKVLDNISMCLHDHSASHNPSGAIGRGSGTTSAEESTTSEESEAASMPMKYKDALLSSLVMMVAYEFDCNVVTPRTLPQLLITTPLPASQMSTFPSAMKFLSRIPKARQEALGGISEGPICALWTRRYSPYKTELEEVMDLALEVNSILVTAQSRAREGKHEIRPGNGKWWTTKPRWGGGPGGPIGFEAERWTQYQTALVEYENATNKITAKVKSYAAALTNYLEAAGTEKPKPPSDKWRLHVYDRYRMVRPPRYIWDKKTRYERIGTETGEEFDDIFLLSCMNHHISMTRTRVPNKLLDQLDGQDGPREKCTMWRSRWWDMFVVEDRVEALDCIWGMMAYTTREMDEVVTEIDTSEEEL